MLLGGSIVGVSSGCVRGALIGLRTAALKVTAGSPGLPLMIVVSMCGRVAGAVCCTVCVLVTDVLLGRFGLACGFAGVRW